MVRAPRASPRSSVERRRAGRRAGALVAGLALVITACSSSGPPGPASGSSLGTTSTSLSGPATTTVKPGPGHHRWTPAPDTAWQWELDHPLDLSSARDMGTGVTDYLGRPAPNPTMYDIDGFDNPAATVAALHGRGDRAVCYIEVGALEPDRPDTALFPRSVVGRAEQGYPDEHYVDIRSPVVLRLVEARIAMCAAKGFDAVEPDIDDSYTDRTGFAISRADEVAYDRQLADYAHQQGLSMALKNGDDPLFAASMEPNVDFVIDEQCFQYQTCDSFNPFVQAGKAVFEVEYQIPVAAFCPQANSRNYNAQRLNVALDGPRKPCR